MNDGTGRECQGGQSEGIRRLCGASEVERNFELSLENARVRHDRQIFLIRGQTCQGSSNFSCSSKLDAKGI